MWLATELPINAHMPHHLRVPQRVESSSLTQAANEFQSQAQSGKTLLIANVLIIRSMLHGAILLNLWITPFRRFDRRFLTDWPTSLRF
jgi:hypothetical protein